MVVTKLKLSQAKSLARSLHEVFCDNLLASRYRHGDGQQDLTHAALVPFRELPKHLKRQNVLSALAIPGQLAACGFTLEERADVGAMSIFTRGELEQLAALEHKRWGDDELERDPTRLVNRDRDKLDDSERKKDRLKFEALPALLARESIAIIRIQPPPAKAIESDIATLVARTSLADLGREPVDCKAPHARELPGYTLRIGVAGPTTFQDETKIKQAIRHALDLLQQRIARQKEWIDARLSSVSSLAPGTDQLVARAIVDRECAHQAVLPFAWPDYASTFSPEQRREGLELLRRADRDPLHHDEHDETEETLRARLIGQGVLLELHAPQVMPKHEAERTTAFVNAGLEVVDACELLLAVWNRAPSNEGGGVTATVVEYALERRKQVLCIDPRDPEQPPRWLRARHVANHAAGKLRLEEVPISLDYDDIELGFDRAAALFRESPSSLADIEERLRGKAPEPDAGLHALHGDAGKEAPATSGRLGLLKVAAAHGIPLEPVNDALRRLHAVHVWADQLATQVKPEHQRWTIAVFIFTGLAFAAAALRAVFFTDTTRLTVAEVVFMLAACGAYFLHRTQRYHVRWADYRALAERTRTAVFSLLAHEKPERVRLRGQGVPPLDARERGWIDVIYEELLARTPHDMSRYAHWSAQRDFVVEVWLAEQARWHDKEAHKAHAQHRRLETSVIALFTAIVVAAILHLILHGPWENPLTFVCLILPVLGATLHTLGRHFELERRQRRHAQCAVAVRREIAQLRDARSDEEFRERVRRTAQLLESEHSGWSTLVELTRSTLAP